MIVRVVVDPFEPFEFIDPDKRCDGGIGYCRGQGNSLPGDLVRAGLQWLAIGIHVCRVLGGYGNGFILMGGLANRGPKCPVKTASIFNWRDLARDVGLVSRTSCIDPQRPTMTGASSAPLRETLFRGPLEISGGTLEKDANGISL
jgi:hypothetical protein